jgi:Novel STAND NTPase 1
MQAHQELIPPMTATELRRVIELQAKAVGLRFEADLGATILEDVQGEPGAMPLLQHALRELWRRRRGRWLRSEEYRAIGGVKKAVTHTAEDVYQRLSAQDRGPAREIFLRLTRVDDAAESSEPRDTRQRLRLEDLIRSGDDPARTKALVKRLADEGARLVVTSADPLSGAEEVEVAHEALIRHWPRLREWLEDDRASLRLRQAIGQAALEWHRNADDPSYLVHRGRRLDQAESLFKASTSRSTNAKPPTSRLA